MCFILWMESLDNGARSGYNMKSKIIFNLEIRWQEDNG